MTIDEVLNILKQYIDYDNTDIPDFYTMAEACEVVIKALEKEPCEDCVSREAVMHILDEIGGDFDSPREAVVPIDYIADMVSELPSVMAQPKMGQWNFTKHYGRDYYVCSVCGMERMDDHSSGWNYCPNCGAKMQEVNNE